mmetsp:Transcript_9212/g.20033  ORF Transcript_9212/g.20033 Transcript_9212/m.20033 type:complete len:286 (+) Transcript_9212:29-886(+)
MLHQRFMRGHNAVFPTAVLFCLRPYRMRMGRMSVGFEICEMCSRCSGESKGAAGKSRRVEATRSDECSSFSMGLTLLEMTVSMSEWSKRCVAATSTCREAASKGRAPERESASSRSNALRLSLERSAEWSRDSTGGASSASCACFLHSSPTESRVGRIAASASSWSYAASSFFGSFVKSSAAEDVVEAEPLSELSLCRSATTSSSASALSTSSAAISGAIIISGASSADSIEISGEASLSSSIAIAFAIGIAIGMLRLEYAVLALGMTRSRAFAPTEWTEEDEVG